MFAFRRFALGVVACVVASAVASAGPVRTNAGFTTNTLARNDDGSTGVVPLPFSANFFGLTFNSLFVNNNGNVTFDSALSTFTPFNLNTTNRQMIAPFFGDVDTRGLGNGSLPVQYGNDTVNGRSAFGVNWVDVGYFASQTNKLNSFQLVLIDRSDTGAGNFDIEFNYDKIEWETGGASGGVNGLGGSSARAGFANGTMNPGTFFELPGSAVNGALLNGGASQLITSSNIGVDGRWLFSSRNGQIVPRAVPEPTTLAVFGLALAGLAPMTRRFRRRVSA